MPVFELLELRALLSGNTYTPSITVADSSNTANNNLRSAVAAANADTGAQPDVIQLSSGTYTLSLGELNVTSTAHTLIIEGQGATGPGATIIDQTAVDRVFNWAAGATVIFQNLEITGGTAETNPDGGSINAAGGGILSAGAVTLSGAEVDHNRAVATSSGGNAAGGGIYSLGSLTINAGSIVNNDGAFGGPAPHTGAGGVGYGGGIDSTSGNVQITGATVNANLAVGGAGANSTSGAGGAGGDGAGGGVYIAGSTTSSATLNDDSIFGNVADGGDGGASANTFAAAVSGNGTGGGVFVVGVPATISSSTISGNVANGGTEQNGAVDAKGGFARGGGAEIQGTGSRLLNDTIYGNMANAASGSTSGSAFGAGIDDDSGGLTLVNVTVAANSVLAVAPVAGGTAGTAQGGGISNYFNSDTHLALYNTLDATNSAASGPDFYGTAAIADSNFIGDGTGAAGVSTAGDDNQVGTSSAPLNPKFAAAGLTINGGNTQTVALAAGSTALGTGDVASATAFGLTTDQRGLPRVVAGSIDIGALETQPQLPTVTNATTTVNTQTTAGLVVTPAAIDAAVVTNFEITGITGGSLFLADGVTPVTGGSFITAAQGAAGLKFTPTTGSLAWGSFVVQESTSASAAGLRGAQATATITVTLVGPKVTGATTTENTPTTSGLVITPASADTLAGFIRITGLTGGTLYQHDGVTAIANGSFITVAQGEAGLVFKPTTGFLGTASFAVQESTTASVGGLSGAAATATIAVTLSPPTVTPATTLVNKQTTGGLVITPGAGDTSAAYFQITSINGGTLYQNNGTTAITAGSFITLAQGAAGLKFTPNPNSLVAGGFTVRQSTTGDVTGLSGPPARAAITVTPAAPKVTGATTTENVTTTSGLVLTPGDSTANYFAITNVTGGLLYLNNGTSAIPAGSFITVAEGEGGLKFVPTNGTLGNASIVVQEAATNNPSTLTGPATTATIAVTLSQPTVTAATTTESAQSTSGLVITPGPNDTSSAFYQITSITGGTLYQSNGVTPITNGSFISLSEGESGLKFTPYTGSMVPGGFTVRQSTTDDASGLSGPPARAAIAVTFTGPTVTNALTTENIQTSSGLVITPGANDVSAAYFEIAQIVGGTLYLNNGTTQITAGSFITKAQGEAGLKFTPTLNTVSSEDQAEGGISVEESTTNNVSGVSGTAATGSIVVSVPA